MHYFVFDYCLAHGENCHGKSATSRLVTRSHLIKRGTHQSFIIIRWFIELLQLPLEISSNRRTA